MNIYKIWLPKIKWLPAILLALFLPVLVSGQEVGEQSASAKISDFKKVVEMAVLMPASDEFDSTWSEYVGDYLESDAEVSSTIDKVMKGISDYRKSIRVPGASANTGPAMKATTLRSKMQDLADAVLQST